MLRYTSTLPAYASIWGTTHFPPIDNQGAIGSCASQSITRNQFSNAISRWVHKNEEGTKWCPRDHKSECFSPKFTFNFAGAGTAWVYDLVMEHGALFESEDAEGDQIFMKNEQGGSIIRDESGNLYTKTTSWPVREGMMERALNYRITDYRQIWFVRPPYNEKLTTGEDGRWLLVRIKEAIVRGDAVVTGGYPGRWVFSKVAGCGNLGKEGQGVVVAAAGNGGGGHQVTIVGYDDDLTAEFAGVTLKGAFLVANSYGTKWQNDGLCWVMYDAVNTVSEHEALNDDALYSGPMYLTPEDNMRMFPPALTHKNQTFTFAQEGVCTLYGKEYPAYSLKETAGGLYLSYDAGKKDRELFLTRENNCRFALVPYSEMISFPTSDSQYYKAEYEGSYWLYAADKEGGEEGYIVVDAGTGYGSSGRKVGFASHNAARYPEAKSWLLDCEISETFTSRLAIAAGKDQPSKRIWVFDQFCFLNWQKDVTVGMPELYVKLKIKALDRECFHIFLTRREKGSVTKKKIMPAMFRYAKTHPKYIQGKKGEYLNFDGEYCGGEKTGYFAFSYLPLLRLPKGKTISDYEWGIEFKKTKKGSAELLEAELCGCDRQVLAKAGTIEDKIVFPF